MSSWCYLGKTWSLNLIPESANFLKPLLRLLNLCDNAEAVGRKEEGIRRRSKCNEGRKAKGGGMAVGADAAIVLSRQSDCSVMGAAIVGEGKSSAHRLPSADITSLAITHDGCGATHAGMHSQTCCICTHCTQAAVGNSYTNEL